MLVMQTMRVFEIRAVVLHHLVNWIWNFLVQTIWGRIGSLVPFPVFQPDRLFLAAALTFLISISSSSPLAEKISITGLISNESRRTCSSLTIFCLEFDKIILIFRVKCGFFIFCKVCIILFLCQIGLLFTGFFNFSRKHLPSFTNNLGYFGKT